MSRENDMGDGGARQRDVAEVRRRCLCVPWSSYMRGVKETRKKSNRKYAQLSVYTYKFAAQRSRRRWLCAMVVLAIYCGWPSG